MTVDQHDEEATGGIVASVESHPSLVAISASLRNFMLKQHDTLRLAGYISRRSAEFDDHTHAAIEMLEATGTIVDPASVQKISEALSALFAQATQEDDGSLPEQTLEDIASAVKEAAERLNRDELREYLDAVMRALASPPSTPRLLASLLVSVVGDFEIFFGELVRTLYGEQPQKLALSGKQYTWRDLSNFRTIEELRDHAIAREVDDLLFGSFREWCEYLTKRFDISPPVASDEFLTLELIQRRHVIVHNGGRASQSYLDNLSKFKHSASLGDALVVDLDYLRRALDQLGLVAASMATAANYKLANDTEAIRRAEQLLGDASYYLLQERRHDLVVRMCESLSWDRISDDYSRLQLRVNLWLALKLLGRFEEVRGEVELWDVSTLASTFKLGRLALLDRVDEALEMAERMVANDELRQSHFETWPLLSEVRKRKRERDTPPANMGL